MLKRQRQTDRQILKQKDRRREGRKERGGRKVYVCEDGVGQSLGGGGGGE